MSKNNDNQRSSVRAPVFFTAHYRLLGDEQFLLEEIENNRTSDRFQSGSSAVDDLPSGMSDLAEFQELEPNLYKMWMTLERKIDHVIWLLNKEKFDDEDLPEGRCVDLSAGGVKLSTVEPFTPDDKLLVRLHPPTFPAIIVETASQVIRCESDEKREGRYLISAEFIAINAYDRESLISYLFKRQREILRKDHEEQE